MWPVLVFESPTFLATHSMSDPQNPRRTPRKKAPSLAPLYGAVGIAILAIIAVAMAQKDKDARADAEIRKPATTEVSNPFADLPAGGKVVPSPFNAGSNSLAASASGLLADSVWVEAKALAGQAKKTLLEATTADNAGDRKTYKIKAVQARDLFQRALDTTAQWEIDIEEAHGESDPQVNKVRALRSVWFDQRKKLRSVDVNDI
jgi:hypothetical protein